MDQPTAFSTFFAKASDNSSEKVLIKLFQKFAGQGQRPCRRPQTAKPPCASEWRRPGDIPEGAKSSPRGGFCSFTPRAPQSAQSQ